MSTQPPFRTSSPVPRVNRIESDFDVFRGRPRSTRPASPYGSDASLYARSRSKLREEGDISEGARLVGEEPSESLAPPYSKNAASYSSYSLDAKSALSRGSSHASHRSPEDEDADEAPVPHKRPVRFSKASWVGVTSIILAVFSTVFSLLFLLIAAFKPRYGYFIHTSGKLYPNTANLLATIFAKLIEISFVSVFVAFLGQVLSRRSLVTDSKGITMSEILMKGWVTQPGLLLTTQSLRFAGPTFLGGLSLFVTVVAALYTTASQSLVTPSLQWGGMGAYELAGLVSVGYANSTTLINLCPAVVSSAQDGPINGNPLPVSQTTCYNIHNAFPGLRDFTRLTNDFKAYNNNNSTLPRNNTLRRPAPRTTLGGDDINYFGEWTSVIGQNGINNVSLVMPHGGLVTAIRNVTANNIVQPDLTGGFGNCDITASIANPAINVLCAPLNASTVQYFISTGSTSRNGTLDPTIASLFNFNFNASVTGMEDFMTNAKTLGQNGVGYESPRFPSLPAWYNTVIWQTFGYSDPSMYALVSLNGTQPDGTVESQYTMCAIKSYLTPFCSTRYISATGGGNVTVDCSADNKRSLAAEIPGLTDQVQNQFKDIAGEQGFALSFNSPNASISRVFTFLALSTPSSNITPNPSLAEALAALYANTVVLSSVSAQYLSVTPPVLPSVQRFRASGDTQQYASGTSHGWLAAFYVVLVGVCAVNIFCLAYFVMLREMVRDWTETGELFHVGLHSDLQHARGWRPEGRELGSKWWIRQMDDGTIAADKET